MNRSISVLLAISTLEKIYFTSSVGVNFETVFVVGGKSKKELSRNTTSCCVSGRSDCRDSLLHDVLSVIIGICDWLFLLPSMR